MSVTAQKHHVWPVFIVALGLLGVGFYAAVGGPVQVVEDPAESVEVFIPALRAVPNADTTSSSHELAVGTNASSYQLELLQEQRRGGEHVRTRLALTVSETATESVDGNHAIVRSYRGVDLEVGFAKQTSKQVQQLVESAVHRVVSKPTGETVSVELLSTDALQLRPVLELLHQSIALTVPRVPREAVRTGETWKWSLPATAGADAVAGKIEVTARVVGTTPEGVVLEMDLSGGMVLDLSGDETHPQVTNANGTGRGLVLWDVEQRRVAWSEIRWEQQAEVAGSKIDTTSFVRRVSE